MPYLALEVDSCGALEEALIVRLLHRRRRIGAHHQRVSRSACPRLSVVCCGGEGFGSGGVGQSKGTLGCSSAGCDVVRQYRVCEILCANYAHSTLPES